MTKSKRCKGITHGGKRCLQSASIGGYCVIHFEMEQKRKEKEENE